jgi:hypothetical protein
MQHNNFGSRIYVDELPEEKFGTNQSCNYNQKAKAEQNENAK